MAMKLGDKKLRIGVFGTGWWSGFQIPAWLEIGNVEIVALYNRTIGKAQKIADLYGISKVYGDAEELLMNEQIDFMDIITEVPLHAELVSLAAKYRIPVICQKPMGQDFNTCLSMLQQCREAGIPFLINENYRWQYPIRTVKKLIQEGHIGKPFRAHIELSNWGPEAVINQPFLKTLRHYVLFDLGIHMFDVARFLFGEPDRIYCQANRSVDWMSGDDTAAAILTFKDTICTCELSNLLPTKIFVEGLNGVINLKCNNEIEIITKQGTRVIDCNSLTKPAWCTDETAALLGTDIACSIIDCQKNLLEELRYGKPAETRAEDNIKTVRLLFSAIQSVLTGNAVHLI